MSVLKHLLLGGYILGSIPGGVKWKTRIVIIITTEIIYCVSIKQKAPMGEGQTLVGPE
jgi:hypothetical protein